MRFVRKSCGNHFRRVGALLSALLMICCLTVPALAATGTEADMPSSSDFLSHPFSWFVWRENSVGDGYRRYELISSPIIFSGSFLSGSGFSYSFSVNSREFKPSGSDSDYYTYGFPTLAEPRGSCGSWSFYPDFPIGSRFFPSALFRVYAGSTEFLSFYGSVCPSPESFFLSNFASTSSGYGELPVTSFSQWIYPVVRGPYRNGNTFANDWVAFSGLDNNVVADSSGLSGRAFSPSYCPVVTYSYSNWGSAGWKDPDSHFSDSYHFSSTDARFWLLNPSSLTGSFSGRFACSLLVPSHLLPSDVAVGDWISQGTMDKLQDQLVNDFDVNSDTLENSKQNFDSWQNSNTIDTDVANTSLDIINGLLQNVGNFAFIVSLLCFGAVVLRVLIRKAVEG